jgi:hypothetical protein
LQQKAEALDLSSKNHRQHDPVSHVVSPAFIFILEEIWTAIGCGLGHYLV